jgi:CRP/FNR family transcriptional regulator, cyclic AMP receptor protein
MRAAKKSQGSRTRPAESQQRPPTGDARAARNVALRPHQLDLFSELTPDERDAFLARCTRQNFEPGANLFSQDEPYTRSYLIRSGMVRTYYVSPSGKEITIAYWSEGAMVGGPNVFCEQRPHIWSAQAVTQVVAEHIRGQDLQDLSMRIPRLAHYLIETLSYKLHWVSVLLQTFGTQSVRARVAHLLLQLGERYGEEHETGILIAQQFSHEDLGQMVGATRSWVTLALKQLKGEGIITTLGRDTYILDNDRLRQAAQGRLPGPEK